MLRIFCLLEAILTVLSKSWTGTILKLTWHHTSLKPCMRGSDVCDVWRAFHGVQRQCTLGLMPMTMSSPRPDLIDLIVLNINLNICKSCSIWPVSFSDLSLIQCDVFLGSALLWSVYWHFSTTLVHDEGFTDVCTFFWDTFKKHKASFTSLQHGGTWGKCKVHFSVSSILRTSVGTRACR